MKTDPMGEIEAQSFPVRLKMDKVSELVSAEFSGQLFPLLLFSVVIFVNV